MVQEIYQADGMAGALAEVEKLKAIQTIKSKHTARRGRSFNIVFARD